MRQRSRPQRAHYILHTAHLQSIHIYDVTVNNNLLSSSKWNRTFCIDGHRRQARPAALTMTANPFSASPTITSPDDLTQMKKLPSSNQISNTRDSQDFLTSIVVRHASQPAAEGGGGGRIPSSRSLEGRYYHLAVSLPPLYSNIHTYIRYEE